MIPKHCIVFLLLFPLLAGSLRAGDFETNYGIGVIRIRPYNYFTLSFWKKPGIVDLYDFEEVYFYRDSLSPRLHFHFATMDPDSMPAWFSPEVFTINGKDPRIELFCVEKDGNWCKVIANKKTGEFKWVELGVDVQFYEWAAFLKTMNNVYLTTENTAVYAQIPPLKKSKAKKIKSQLIDGRLHQRVIVKDVQGEWMQIEINSINGNNQVTSTTSGWIRWHDEDHVFVELKLE